ncbi:MAG TPA: M28 family peptidase [Gemmatimonadaceae bacterium]|nr:M28 family peptidase [Gemmatimonadaceae bacterium]
MAQSELVHRAKGLLTELAQNPRFAGSAQESAARTLCRAELERAGFECRDLPFAYSQWPGRWGPPIAAAFQAATVIIVARTAMVVSAFAAILVGAALFTTLFFVDADAKRRWTRKFPFQRAHSVNLEARRGNPSVWLVAHLDSKSQTVPMLIRIASSIAVTFVTAIALVILGLSLLGLKVSDDIWPAIEVVVIVAVLPSLFCFVRNESNGAVDNASGTVAVLLVAHSASAPRELGVLITSGEELGLAGARAWAGEHVRGDSAKSGPKVLNCDTVDDAGDWRCMYTGPRPKRIADAAETIARELGVRLPMGRLIPGILADGMAFADLGIEAVTLSRGTLSTLARIHTRRDNSNAMGGSGAAEASVLLSALAKELG